MMSTNKLEISKESNPNYLAKVVRLEGLRKHSNADRLQCVNIDFNNVITGMDAKDHDIYIYFPVESTINKDFLSETNSFRDSSMNKNKEGTGFFEKHGRVKAISLRGEQSMGYIVPASVVFEWAKFDKDPEQEVGKEFDLINGLKICEKYVPEKRTPNPASSGGKKPRLSRLIEGQVHLHVDTINLRKVVGNIQPSDYITVTYKTHGSSWWVSNVLVKRELTWLERLGKKLGLKIKEEQYDIVYGSRKVVKNKYLQDRKRQDHFFGYNLWKSIKDEVEDKIPKGFTLYGEVLGYTKDGAYIQKPYDYRCEKNKFRLEVYRITFTNVDGKVFELNYRQMEEFCNSVGLTPVHKFYEGKAMDLFDIPIDENWSTNFVEALQDKYNNKDCFMCDNSVPEEGIVVRKESLLNCEVYKLKSHRFLLDETKALDN